MPKKLTFEYVKQKFTLAGCELLDGDYVDAKTKMKYKCACGGLSEITWSDFSQGKRCANCGGTKKFTIDNARQTFAAYQCVLLENVYCNNRTQMLYICSCGNKSTTTLTNLKKGQRCRKCGVERITGDKHYRWITNRQLVQRRKSFIARCRNLLIKSYKKDSDKVIANLGYTPNDLRSHIRNHAQFESILGKINIDHIFPIKAFLDHGLCDLCLINCLDNLQPLSESENKRKNRKYDKQEFLSWLKSKKIVTYQPPLDEYVVVE